MPDTRAIASLNKRTKSDEDRCRWALEQAVKTASAPLAQAGGVWTIDPVGVVNAAKKFEDYVSGRTTT
jgi:hypothetical protein